MLPPEALIPKAFRADLAAVAFYFSSCHKDPNIFCTFPINYFLTPGLLSNQPLSLLATCSRKFSKPSLHLTFVPCFQLCRSVVCHNKQLGILWLSVQRQKDCHLWCFDATEATARPSSVLWVKSSVLKLSEPFRHSTDGVASVININSAPNTPTP